MVFFQSDKIPMFLGHTVTRYHRHWCDYLDFTIVDNLFFSRCFVSFQDFPRYIFGCLWFLVVQGLLSSTLQFFAKPSGPMFLRFIDHRMWLFLIRAAQVVPACQPGCEKMEREWENEEEMEREFPLPLHLSLWHMGGDSLSEMHKTRQKLRSVSFLDFCVHCIWLRPLSLSQCKRFAIIPDICQFFN